LLEAKIRKGENETFSSISRGNVLRRDFSFYLMRDRSGKNFKSNDERKLECFKRRVDARRKRSCQPCT
jgi:hypothetical protein